MKVVGILVGDVVMPKDCSRKESSSEIWEWENGRIGTNRDETSARTTMSNESAKCLACNAIVHD